MDKIVVFGTGNAGRAIYKKFSKEHEIVAFIDNNKDMIGKKYKNIPVFSLKLKFPFFTFFWTSSDGTI